MYLVIGCCLSAILVLLVGMAWLLVRTRFPSEGHWPSGPSLYMSTNSSLTSTSYLPVHNLDITLNPHLSFSNMHIHYFCWIWFVASCMTLKLLPLSLSTTNLITAKPLSSTFLFPWIKTNFLQLLQNPFTPAASRSPIINISLCKVPSQSLHHSATALDNSCIPMFPNPIDFSSGSPTDPYTTLHLNRC